MTRQPQPVASSPTSAFSRRWRWLIALLPIAVACVIWPWPAPIDARLIGKWEARPEPYATFPIQLNVDGSAQLIDIYCGGRYTQTYDWTRELNEVRLYFPAPRLNSFALTEIASFVRSSVSRIAGRSRAPVRRYRIVADPKNELCLEPVAQSFLDQDEVKAFQRTAVPIEESPAGLGTSL